jgi:hypothetical protein
MEGRKKRVGRMSQKRLVQAIQGIIGVLALCVYGLKPESVD